MISKSSHFISPLSSIFFSYEFTSACLFFCVILVAPDARILFSSRKVICRVRDSVKCLILINSQNSAFQQEITFPVFLVKREVCPNSTRITYSWKNQESPLSLFITQSWWVTHKWLTFYVFFSLFCSQRTAIQKRGLLVGHVSAWGLARGMVTIATAPVWHLPRGDLAFGETLIVDYGVQWGESENWSHSTSFQPLSCYT